MDNLAKRIAIGAALAFSGCFVFYLPHLNPQLPNGNVPRFERPFFDCGFVPNGTTTVIPLLVTNPSAEDYIVEKSYGSCQCSAVSFPRFIPAKSTIKGEVRINGSGIASSREVLIGLLISRDHLPSQLISTSLMFTTGCPPQASPASVSFSKENSRWTFFINFVAERDRKYTITSDAEFGIAADTTGSYIAISRQDFHALRDGLTAIEIDVSPSFDSGSVDFAIDSSGVEQERISVHLRGRTDSKLTIMPKKVFFSGSPTRILVRSELEGAIDLAGLADFCEVEIIEDGLRHCVLEIHDVAIKKPADKCELPIVWKLKNGEEFGENLQLRVVGSASHGKSH